MGTFIIIWSLDEWNERNCSPPWKAEMSREQLQINLLRISRRLNSVTQKDGNIWNKLQCKITMISRPSIKDIHPWLLQWNRDFCMCVYERQSLSRLNWSLSFRYSQYLWWPGLNDKLCSDLCGFNQNNMSGVFLIFFIRHTNKMPHRQFSVWRFSCFAVTFVTEFSVCKRYYVMTLCNWKPLFIDRSWKLEAGEISLCQTAELHPPQPEGMNFQEEKWSISVSPIWC